MPRVYMIRHGKPTSGWGDNDGVADLDPGLDEAGKRQAEAASRALLAMPEPPTRVITSPLRRCRETAIPFASALGVEAVVDPRVAEIPSPNGLAPLERVEWLRRSGKGTWAEIKGDLDYLAWRANVVAALIANPGAAIFSHFVALNAAVSHALGRDEMMVFRPDNGSITVFETDGATLSLVALGGEAETRVL